MRNIWLICAKEMKAYFASPIAYAVLGLFSFLFGALVFYPTIRELSQMAVQMQMQGQPLNLNDQVIRPLLGFASTISLFVLPLITMRLFAEEKGSGTMELLLTSPVYDAEIILGKWLGAMLLYMSMLGMSVLNIMFLYFWGKPGRCPAGNRSVHLQPHQKPGSGRRRHVFRLPHPVAAELVHVVLRQPGQPGVELPVDCDSLR